MIKQYFARQADPIVSSDPESELVFNLFEEFFFFSGQELPHQLPRHGPDHWQAEVHGEEVADADRGKLRRQDHRWLYSEVYSRSEKYSRKFLKWCISICYSWLLHDDTHHQDLWLEPTLFSETFSNLCHFLNFFILQAFLHRIHQKARDVHKEDRLCTGWTGD